jgi:hypothetical protein
MIRRPFADTLEATVVWVSGAVSALQVHPSVLRQSDVRNYEHFVERILGFQALSAENFR